MSTTTKITNALIKARADGRVSSEFGVEALVAAISSTISDIDSADDNGYITTTLPNVYANGTTITAGTTQTQAGATALTKEFNNITTVTTAGDGVALPTAVAGLSVTVKNGGANALTIYPFLGDFIDDESVNVGISVPVEATVVFKAISTTTWESDSENVVGTVVTTGSIVERVAGAGTAVKNPSGIITAATLAPTALTSNSYYALSKVDGLTVTLPALSATNIGLRYKFAIITSCTSVGYIFNTTGTNVFIGGVYGTIAGGSDAAADSELSVSSVNKTITLGATTTCGLAGGWIEVVAISATQWSVSGIVLGSGTIATPFSN